MIQDQPTNIAFILQICYKCKENRQQNTTPDKKLSYPIENKNKVNTNEQII